MRARPRIKILSVEDHPVFREGLRFIVGAQSDMEIVARASSLDEAVAEFQRVNPDVTLMDMHLPGSDGTETLFELHKLCPTAPIAMLMTCEGDANIHNALKAYDMGYVLRSMPKDDLATVIRAAHDDKEHFAAVAIRLAGHFLDDKLTPREIQVLELIRDGSRDKEIADQLSISEPTVHFHITNAVDKLQAKNRTHAVIVALRRGLIALAG